LLKPKSALVVALLITYVLFVQAQTGRKRSAANSNEEIGKTIEQLESQLRIAALKPDPGWFDVHLAERYTEVDAQGKVQSRKDVITALRSGDLAYDAMNLSEGEASIYNGDSVLLIQKEQLQGGFHGRNFSGVFRCSRFWVKQNGEWQLAATQRTPITGEAGTEPKP